MPARQLSKAHPPWSFLTNYAHVLLCLAAESRARTKDIAVRVGITERAVQRIIAELEEAGYITRSRDGRRNRYSLDPSRPLRHALGQQRIGALLALMAPPRSR